MTQTDRAVRIVEVGPRDGLQNEEAIVPADAKVAFIEALASTGLQVVEATSFVSPRAIPQLADADEVFPRIRRRSGVRYPVLVPNLRGLERAEAAGVVTFRMRTPPSAPPAPYRPRWSMSRCPRLSVRKRFWSSCSQR